VTVLFASDENVMVCFARNAVPKYHNKVVLVFRLYLFASYGPKIKKFRKKQNKTKCKKKDQSQKLI
jgi:ABC-type transporter MlaC component